ncbi:MAG: DUF6288 domain-containing protein, partial [Fimbriiglobus sp.]
DVYGKKPTVSVTPPNVRSVSFATAERDTLTLEFDQPVVWKDVLAGQFYLDGAKGQITGGSVTGSTLTLKLKAATTAKTVTYLKESAWNQDALLLGANGIAALTFCEVPILPHAPATPVSTTVPTEGKSVPDFTKNGKVPEGAKHDWNLGPTGLRGWIYCDQLVTTDARQILITKVDAGSPAADGMRVGDVILGVAGKLFSHDPRTELGRAVTAAETKAGAGKLALTRWRAGKTDEVVLRLPVLGSYGDTAPYDCEKSKRLLERGCKVLAARMVKPDYADATDPILRSVNALALLAGGNPEYLPLVKAESRWAAGFTTDSMHTWYNGYCLLLSAEYTLATGDTSNLPGMTRLALEAARGQSAVGSWGHRFARPDGRLFGYGMMNSPGLVLTTGLVLAREAGVKDPDVTTAIERSAKLLRFYIGK